MVMPNFVIHADCRHWLNTQCWQTFDFIFADPPFNIDQNYDGYYDNMTEAQYGDFTDEWLIACWRKLNPGGAMVVHASWKLNYHIVFALKFLSMTRYIEQEIVWAYNFGQCTFDKFISGHCKAIVLRKPPIKCERKWYPKQILVESLRKRIGDKRIADSPYAGMVVPTTVWGFANDFEPWEPETNWGRVQGNNSERNPSHPNQLPELYVARFVKAFTVENDLVYDPFGGSGTTAVVAQALKRRFVTTEISLPYCQSIRERLKKGVVRNV